MIFSEISKWTQWTRKNCVNRYVVRNSNGKVWVCLLQQHQLAQVVRVKWVLIEIIRNLIVLTCPTISLRCSTQQMMKTKVPLLAVIMLNDHWHLHWVAARKVYLNKIHLVFYRQLLTVLALYRTEVKEVSSRLLYWNCSKSFFSLSFSARRSISAKHNTDNKNSSYSKSFSSSKKEELMKVINEAKQKLENVSFVCACHHWYIFHFIFILNLQKKNFLCVGVGWSYRSFFSFCFLCYFHCAFLGW